MSDHFPLGQKREDASHGGGGKQMHSMWWCGTSKQHSAPVEHGDDVFRVVEVSDLGVALTVHNGQSLQTHGLHRWHRRQQESMVPVNIK